LLRGLAGGAACAVALPTLEAMLGSHGDAFADGSPIPKRLMTWFFGNGVRLDKWVPPNQGASYTLTEELLPLANVKHYVSVLTGFQNRCEKLITHHEGMTVLTGYTMVEVNGLFSKPGGATVDQIAADVIGGATPIQSVQLGVSKHLSVMDSGTTMHNISHKGTNQPLPAMYNPQDAFNYLFGTFTPKDDPSKPVRLSVVDSVRADAAALRKRLGKKDNERVDAHLEGLFALEKKINALPPLCEAPGMPSETNVDVDGVEPLAAVNAAMADLLAYAFACDVTRVASFFYTGGAAETVYNFDPFNHSYSHHTNTHDGSAQDKVHDVVLFTMQCFAYLLERFMATDDGPNGNLLDNTAILCTSDCAEGFTHSVFDQAVLVAGRGGGSLAYPGVHYRSPNAESITDITLSVLQTVAPEVTEMGGGAPYSNTPCPALKA
jgi:hypothetical protein